MFDRKEYFKQYYLDNKEKIKKQNREYKRNNCDGVKIYQNKRYILNKQYINDYKLSKGCSICGYNKYACALVFHHKDDNKEFWVSQGKNKSLKRTKEEISKCIVLCRNCHAELHEKIRKLKELTVE